MSGYEEQRQGFRLSPQQRRTWRLAERWSGEGQPFLGYARVVLEGEAVPGRLATALAELQGRYEILRTVFRRAQAAGPPLQMVLPPSAVELHVEPPTERIDVEAGPVLRATWRQEGPRRGELLLELPALACDSVTWRRIVAELAEAYAGGEAPEDEPLQYVDLADWQHEIREGEEAHSARLFWQRGDRSLLAGPAPALTRDRAAAFDPLRLRLELPSDLAGALGALAERWSVTLPTVLLAAWSALVARLTGQERVVVASSFSGRSYEGLETAVGPLERHLPVPARVAPAGRFGALVQEVGRAVDEIYEWQEYFEWEQGIPSGQDSAEASVPMAFHYEDGPAEWRAGSVSFRLVDHGAVNERFLLRAGFQRRGDRLTLEMDADAARIGKADARRIAEQLVTLLTAAAATPDAAVADLEVLGDEERRRLLVELNDADPGPVDRSKTFLDLFAEQVAARPDEPAVVCGGHGLTYGELDALAGRIAGRLAAAGVGVDRLVGVCLERSVELVACLLGILRAGGAYVPLDPGYPGERKRHILEHARAPWLVTQRDLVPELGAHAERTLVIGDLVDGPEEPEPAAALAAPPPQSLAYVKYTSGSTGRPKGVMVTHGNVGHALQALAARLDVGASDVYLHTASFAFSSSTRHLLFPLSRGARVVVADGDQRMDPHRLVGLVRTHGVTVVDTVPAIWRSMLGAALAEGAGGVPDTLRLGLSTGEALHEEVPRRWQSHARMRFVNLYGVTETATTLTAHEVEPEPEHREGPAAIVPVGRPLADTRLYLWTHRARLAPLGAPGEILVAGGAPGRGYLERPRLTAERFLPDPYGPIPGGRLFRTLDLGRMHPDGTVDYLGRLDDQVQIHGYRVEPGEVQAVLARHPAVAACAVLPRTHRNGETTLVGYVVAEEGRVVEAPRLRVYLRESLPEYMVPPDLIPLDEMPLTPHGKVDVAALTRGDDDDREKIAYVPARTPTEKRLVEIWEQFLDVDRLGAEDDFIEAGGHSMTAILIIARIHEELGVELPVVELFEHRTVARLASLLEKRQGAAAEETTAAVARNGAP